MSDGMNALANGETMHLALYKTNGCGFCHMVFRVIEGLAVNIEYRDLNNPSHHRSDLYTLTSRSTVPCLVIDGKPMFESRDIITWLREHFDAA